jgi:hypothetical protein
MKFNHKIYKLNSLRSGFITSDKFYGKPLMIVVCASQSDNITLITEYKQNENLYNIIIQPYNLNNNEPGDDYEVYHFYENILNIDYPVCEKITSNHVFFKDFGQTEKNFTNYIFDEKLNFVKKTIGPNNNE